MEELKPCPFCKGEAHYNRKQIQQGYIVVGYDCKQCGAAATVFTGPMTAEKNMKIQATEAWNRRAEPKNKALTLPAAVGQTIYFYCAETSNIIPMMVSRIEVKEHGIYCFAHDTSGEQYRVCILDNGRDDFKAHVAYTREAAEQVKKDGG